MPKLSDEKTKEIIERVTEFRQDCEMGNADLFARMTKAEQFKLGIQWDPQVRAYRERKGKFCLTIPLIKPQIKQVVGSQIQNPKDIVVSAERSGSATGARILTKLAKHAMDSESAVFEETQWFESGLSSGVGFLAALIDRSEDPRHGNLTIERLNEFECGMDPNCVTYDLNSYMSGAKYFIWEPWVDKDLIHEKYPDKKQEIEGTGEAGSLRDPTGLWGWLWGEVRKVYENLTGYHPSQEENVAKYKYKVTHTWWRKPKRCVVFYESGKSETEARVLTHDDEIKAAKLVAKENPERGEVEEVVVNVMCHTIRIGNTLLEHHDDELNGVNMFPLGVYSAYFDNGYRAGMAEDMIGTQEEINWSHSQSLQVIRHLSTYHWIIAEDRTGKASQELQANADEDNLVLDESKYGGKVEKSQSRPYLGGLDRVAQQGVENLKLISNVRTEDPAFDTKNMSGRAILAKQMNSQTGQAAVFQNFDYALSLFAKLVIEIIRANGIYSHDEIREICEKDDLIDAELMAEAKDQVRHLLQDSGVQLPEPPDLNTQAMTPQDIPFIRTKLAAYAQFEAGVEQLARPIAEEKLLEEISMLRKGRYTTKVTLSSYAPTMRLAEKAEIMELNNELRASGYPPVSRKHLIEASDVKNKEEILQEDKAMAANPQQRLPAPAPTQKKQPAMQGAA